MANPTCTTSGLTASCFRVPFLGPKQQKALLIQAKKLELAAIGGTDYVGRDALLLSDAATLTCGMRKPDLDAAMLQIAYNNAAAAGAVVPATLEAKLAQVVCRNRWQRYPIVLFLNWTVGYALPSRRTSCRR